MRTKEQIICRVLSFNILKFSLHSSGTTTTITRLLRYALVLPSLSQKETFLSLFATYSINFFSSSVCCSGNLLTKQTVLRNELNRPKQSCLQLIIYFFFAFDQVNHQFHINFVTRNTPKHKNTSFAIFALPHFERILPSL